MATQTNPVAGAPVEPQIEDGEIVYVRIMGAIEPDLLPENVAQLDEKYAEEKPEETQRRAARYKRALVAYEEQYAAYRSIVWAQVRQFRSGTLSFFERQLQEQEQGALTLLEQAIDAAEIASPITHAA